MRIDTLTSQLDPKRNRAPFTAIIANDGTVSVLHSVLDNRTFPSEQSYRQWVSDEGLKNGGPGELQLIEVNSQGKMPKVY